jgi:hypothetical protein
MSAVETIIEAEVIEDITETTPRQEYAKSLHALADMLDANPAVPLPSGFGDSRWSPIRWYASNVQEAARVQRAIGGRWEKNDPNKSEYDADYLVLNRKLGEEVHVQIVVSREKVCEKTVVGTERKKVRKLVSEAVYEEVYETVDKIELKCGSLLSAADKAELEAL